MSKKKRKLTYSGKKFEEDFKKSVKNDVFVHRLKDNAHNWAGVTNICDFFLYKTPILYMMELKSTNGKSLPFGNISPHQLEGLDTQSTLHKNIVGGFLVHFNQMEETYFVFGDTMKSYIDSNTLLFTETNGKEGRKSIPLVWFKYNGIKVNNYKKISRYTFNIDLLLKQIAILQHLRDS